MMGSNAYRRKKLEIKRRIEYYQEQMKIYPYTKREALANIEELEDEEERLDLDYRRQKQTRDYGLY